MRWLRDLNGAERRTMLAAGGGWALDAFDVQVYSFVIPTLIAAWGISRAEAGMLGTVALLVSALGGWLTGVLCDRFGRVRMLQITILWFAVFTFLSGFTRNFNDASEVAHAFDATDVALVVDGGRREGDPPTLVDATVSPVRVLREGALPSNFIDATMAMGARRKLFNRTTRRGD